MLLSRIAETMFWLGRYVERGEDLSRVIVAHEQLYLDIPKDAATWHPLLELCGLENDSSVFETGSAQNLVRKLVKGEDNPASIQSTLQRAKENLRLSRPLLPKESWQVLNATGELLEKLPPGAYLTEICRTLTLVVEHCQRLTGQIDGCMSRDEAFSFFHIGRLLERSDITFRVIVMLGEVLTNREVAKPFANVRWLGTLKYLAADHMFLRRYHARAERSIAVKFLLFDPWFPRSVYYCLTSIERELETLPNSVQVLESCRACHQEQSVIDAISHAGVFATGGLARLAELSDTIDQTYFRTPVDLLEGSE